MRQSFVPPSPSRSTRGVAALLSLVLPGAGQMYAGQVGTGLAWLVVVGLAYVLFRQLGVILHLLCVLTAYHPAPPSAPQDEVLEKGWGTASGDAHATATRQTDSANWKGTRPMSEIVLWTLAKPHTEVQARSRPTSLGTELRILIDGEVWLSRAFPADAVDALTEAAEHKRQEFLEQGWAPR